MRCSGHGDIDVAPMIGCDLYASTAMAIKSLAYSSIVGLGRSAFGYH